MVVSVRLGSATFVALAQVKFRLHVRISFVQQSAHNVEIFAYERSAWIHGAFEKHHGKEK